MGSITIRILRQIRNDRRSLALLIVAPVFILTLLYFLLGTSDYRPKIGVYGLPDAAIATLEDKLEVDLLTTSPEDPYDYLATEDMDAYLQFDAHSIKVYTKESSSKTALIRQALSSLTQSDTTPQMYYQYETSSDNQLDSLAYVFLGILAFFFVFLFAGVSFVSERNTQTLDRMLLSPLSKASIVAGYILGYGFLSALQSTLMVLFAKYVLKLNFIGSVGICILIMVLLSFCAVACGTLLSIFAKNQFQMIQFIPIIIVPQIFFSGLIPLDTIPLGIGHLSAVFPVFYGCFALKEVMIYGFGIVEILPYLAGLLLYTFILFLLNVLALRRTS